MPHPPPEMLLPTTLASLLARSGPNMVMPVSPERLMSLERILVPVDSKTSTPSRLPMRSFPAKVVFVLTSTSIPETKPLKTFFSISNLGKQCARDPHSSPGRGDSLSRDGSKALGVGTAPTPVDEDVIALGEDVQHLEVDVGEGRHEALVVTYTLGLVQGDRHTWMSCFVVLCYKLRP